MEDNTLFKCAQQHRTRDRRPHNRKKERLSRTTHKTRKVIAMKSKNISAVVIKVVSLAVLLTMALAAQVRFTLKVPNGVAFSEFRGYDTWQDVAVSQTQDGIKAILANPAMINAYRKGIPGNGKPFPDGSMVVKIEWTKKQSAESPYFVEVPDKLVRR
jgi:hypothetical protein